MTREEILKSAKPILFNTDMVLAIMDGRKTVTRRAVKKQHLMLLDSTYHKAHPEASNDVLIKKLCEPPYHPGDILYIRETWDSMAGSIFGDLSAETVYFYKADGDFRPVAWRGNWRPSIHMPKEAARIFLRVTDVRVERLQECGKGWCLDIEKEGVVTPQAPILYINDDMYHDALREEFCKLWNSTIKKSDLVRYGWDANPWVWVIEFERIKTNENTD